MMRWNKFLEGCNTWCRDLDFQNFLTFLSFFFAQMFNGLSTRHKKIFHKCSIGERILKSLRKNKNKQGDYIQSVEHMKANSDWLKAHIKHMDRIPLELSVVQVMQSCGLESHHSFVSQSYVNSLAVRLVNRLFDRKATNSFRFNFKQ